jgi:hypothetical protein
MLKYFVHSGKFGLGESGDPSQLSMAMIAFLGLGLLAGETAVLAAQGNRGSAIALVAVFAASTVSSIAGFAFSALCGALLFHLIDNPFTSYK